MNGVLNAGYPGYPNYSPNQTQSLPQQQQVMSQPMPVSQPIRQQQMMPQQQQQMMPAVPQPNSYSGQPTRTNVSRPLMSSSPLSDPGSDQVPSGGHVASVPGPGGHGNSGDDENTRMQMRQQRDVANAAGIKCSQF